MTVQYILLVYFNWKNLRDKYIRSLRTTNLSSILNLLKEYTAAIALTVYTKFLEQFKGIVYGTLAIPQREKIKMTSLNITDREP
jgi:hypothetical protein